MKKNKANYKFTNKEHPKRGIVSTILGIISLVAIVTAVYLTFCNKGTAFSGYGAGIFLALLFSLTGLTCGILSRMERDMYYIFPTIGIVTNSLALSAISFMLYAGAYGL